MSRASGLISDLSKITGIDEDTSKRIGTYIVNRTNNKVILGPLAMPFKDAMAERDKFQDSADLDVLYFDAYGHWNNVNADGVTGKAPDYTPDNGQRAFIECEDKNGREILLNNTVESVHGTGTVLKVNGEICMIEVDGDVHEVPSNELAVVA
ncbi:hypothetical protein EVB97_330 [Rhizobium phage RHph_Y65]|uniref:Uncharacterized protein n=1 Tax=Rhizobium phage RHph_Y65 TaxID=2509785 RepID=A0A7S5R8D1_9CAUD|nr:hypothetical protein PQC17_gp331 [Rhizobium phage RHph_Y65]QIG72868.1 hypothetical protein EVB97_330 [Rhizobium phage RHph_Y65]